MLEKINFSKNFACQKSKLLRLGDRWKNTDFEPRNSLSCKTKNTNFEGKEKMVDKNGANSNQDAFKELTRWGVIIEKTRGFPSHYEIGSK